MAKTCKGRRTILAAGATLCCTFASFAGTLALFDHTARPAAAAAGGPPTQLS